MVLLCKQAITLACFEHGHQPAKSQAASSTDYGAQNGLNIVFSAGWNFAKGLFCGAERRPGGLVQKGWIPSLAFPMRFSCWPA